MKTLILKEWRERRLVFLAVIGLVFISHAFSRIFTFDHEFYALVLSYYIIPVVFAFFLGVDAFSRSFTSRKKPLIEAFPGAGIKIFFIRFLAGLVILTTPALVSFLVFRVPFRVPSGVHMLLDALLVEPLEHVRIPVFYFLFPATVLYAAVCSGSALCRNKFFAVILSPALILAVFILLIPLFVVFFLAYPPLLLTVFLISLSVTTAFLVFCYTIWRSIIAGNAFPLKKVVCIAVSISAFSLIAHGVSSLSAGRSIGRALRLAGEEEISIEPEEVIPPAVPDEDNAALLYREAFVLAGELKEKYGEEWEYIPYVSGASWEELTDEQKTEISGIMDEPGFYALFSLIEEAAGMPACRFDIRYEDGPSALLPHLSGLNTLARLVKVRTHVLVEDGSYRKAVQTAKTGLMLGNSLAEEPIVISQLVRLSVDRIALENIKNFFKHPEAGFSADDYREFVSVLSVKERFLTQGLEGELMSWSVYQEALSYFLLEIQGIRMDYRQNRRGIKLLTWLLSPVFRLDSAFYIRRMIELIVYSRQPYWLLGDELEEWNETVESWKHPGSRFVLPTLSRFLEQQALYHAHLDAALMALSLEIYRLENGYYPESLAGLVPGVMPGLPPDPFTGEDYIYRRGDKGFSVYSVGPSRRDDGGIFDRSRGYDDIVWRSNRKAPEDRAERGPVPGRNWISPSTGMEFVWIEQMSMWVGRYEVTNREYREKEPEHDSGSRKGHTLNRDRQPVVRVNFEDAKAYAEWMTEKDGEVLPRGYRYRLPAESEWMTYAGCGDGREYPWGNDWPPISGRAGNYADEALKRAVENWEWGIISGYEDGHAVSAPVDELWVNPWGLAGVGGNVWEATASDSDAGSFGAWRGASWYIYSQDIVRCSSRSYCVGSFRRYSYGFRLVLSR